MFYNAVTLPEDAYGMANSTDSDEAALGRESDLGLHCLL